MIASSASLWEANKNLHCMINVYKFIKTLTFTRVWLKCYSHALLEQLKTLIFQRSKFWSKHFGDNMQLKKFTQLVSPLFEIRGIILSRLSFCRTYTRALHAFAACVWCFRRYFITLPPPGTRAIRVSGTGRQCVREHPPESALLPEVISLLGKLTLSPEECIYEEI